MQRCSAFLSFGSAFWLTILLYSCGTPSGTDADSSVTKIPDSTAVGLKPNRKLFADTIGGELSHLYEIHNGSIQAYVTDYGGRLVSLFVPDKTGKTTDVLAGFDSVQGYERTRDSYFGALIGRYGNRIGKGKFHLDGKTYSIPINNGNNALHGGTKGFSDYIWDTEKMNDSTLVLTFASPDGDMGFPGNLRVNVTYTLTSAKGLRIDYLASTDKKTVINLTNHAYFNLNGAGSGTILNHRLQMNADGFTPIDSGLIPTGKIASVAGTPFDFRTPTPIGARINTDDIQLRYGKGYDHNFVLSGSLSGDSLRHAGTVWADKSGIVLDIYTKEPGVQLYTGNFMGGKHLMKYQHHDDYRTAFCVETQHYPDSPNEPSFPSTVLSQGHVYRTTTLYQFSTQP